MQNPLTVQVSSNSKPAPQATPNELTLKRREAILEAVALAGERLLKAKDWQEGIQDVLTQLGQALHLGRMRLFETPRDASGAIQPRCLSEWVSPVKDVSQYPPIPWADSCPAFKRKGAGPDFDRPLEHSGKLVFLHRNGFSLALIPIIISDHCQGAISLEDSSNREWHTVELNAIGVAANIIGASLYRKASDVALIDSERKHRTLFETMAQGVVYQGVNGEILNANPAAERILGLTLEEMSGRQSIDPRWRTIHLDGSDYPGETHPSMVALKTGKELINEVMGVFNPRTNSHHWINIHAIPLFQPGESRPFQVYTTFDDVTELIRRERELETISSLSNALRLAASHEELSQIILERVVELYDLHGAAVTAIDSATQELVFEPGLGVCAAFNGQRLSAGSALNQRVIQRSEIYQTEDLHRDANFELRGMVKDSFGALILPLIAQGTPIGALWLCRQAPYNQHDLRLLHALVDLAASAIHRETLHEQTRQRLARLSALRNIDLAITSSLDLRVTLHILLDQVLAQLHVDAANVLLFDPHSQILQFGAGRGFHYDSIAELRLRLGMSAAGSAALDRSTLMIPDVSQANNDERLLRMKPMLEREGFRAYFATPLMAKGQVKGVLEVYHRRKLHPDLEWLGFLETLAGQAAISIDNASLFSDLQRANTSLMMAYDATIEGWSRALDLRDKETEGHTQRVTELTLKLARKFSFSEEELVHIRRGALLHDIGKMGVPDHILLKPGALSDEEWAAMRKHPIYAYELLSPIPFLRQALDIPYCHHEKWDGSGYPRGLTGEQIPLAARLFAMVDVWDALCSDRPYRSAWGQHKALEHIQRENGKHFDPQVVEAFTDLILAEGGL